MRRPWIFPPKPPLPALCAAGTLAAAAVDSPPPPLPRRREAVQDLRPEVSCTPTPFVVEPVHGGALATSPEYPSRAAVLSARVAASPPQSPPLVALSLRALLVGVLYATNLTSKP
jgi:hypothetical protein